MTVRTTDPTEGPATSHRPVISIVINNFNYRRFLNQSIDSALSQDYPRTEVVVVDDASSDGSQELIREYGDRISPVLQTENGGQGAAMNAGFAACTGDAIIFLDADDYLYPAAASSVADHYRVKAAIIQYRLHLVDEGGRVMDLYPRPELQFDSGDVRQKLVETGRFEGTVTSGQAFGRQALAAVLPMPADRFRISADGYLLSTAPFHGDVLAIEQPLGAYRLHGKNLWSSASSGAAGFRRSLLHDAEKFKEVGAQAAKLGLEVPREPGLRDYQHISARLGSMLLEADQHPYPDDSRSLLGLYGARAARRASFGWTTRALLIAWFIAVGVLPRSWSKAVFRWRHEPESRSPAFRRLVSFLRRATGGASRSRDLPDGE